MKGTQLAPVHHGIVGCPRCTARPIGIDRDHRVEIRIQAFDPGQVRLEQLGTAELLGADGPRQHARLLPPHLGHVVSLRSRPDGRALGLLRSPKRYAAPALGAGSDPGCPGSGITRGQTLLCRGWRDRCASMTRQSNRLLWSASDETGSIRSPAWSTRTTGARTPVGKRASGRWSNSCVRRLPSSSSACGRSVVFLRPDDDCDLAPVTSRTVCTEPARPGPPRDSKWSRASSPRSSRPAIRCRSSRGSPPCALASDPGRRVPAR